MGRQYFNGIWHTGFLNLNTGAVETNSSYPNSIYSDLIFFPAGTYTIEGATITEWRLRVYNSDGTYRENISCNSAAVTLKTNIYARILLFHGLSNEQQQTFKIYRGGDEVVKASAQYTIAEIHEECNVVISNESHVFRADKNNTAIADSVTIQIYGYQGNTQMATTVGTISGKPSAGMTTTINNNGKTNTSITVAVTTALTSSIANNGVLTIPITVAGKTFNKTFSWSKAQTGATGATGGTGAAARTYWVTSSANTITRSMKGTLTPTTITFSSYYRDGTSATSTVYAGRFIIQESTDGATWTTKYTSSANESSKVYTPTATTNLVRCTMYAAGGTTVSLDSITIGIIDSIDDLQVGGRNLWLNSSFNNGLNGYTQNPNSGTISLLSETFNGNGIIEITRTGFTSTTISRAYISSTKSPTINSFKEGETFTLSAYVYVDSTNPLDANNNNIMIRGSLGDAPSINISTDAITDEWILYKKTWTATADGTFSNCFVLLGLNGTIRVSQIKLEKANINSNWTPAPEDMVTNEQLISESQSLREIINQQNEDIRSDVETDMKNLKTEIENDYGEAISVSASATKKEIDATTGQKIRDLEKYTSDLKVDGSSFNYSIEKTKGTNLIKNSVMLQNKQNSSSQTKANFWLNKNLQEDFFTNVTCSDVDSIRAKTDSGSAIIFDYSTDATGLTYDYILSAPVDFKLNTDNIMLSYKIKGAITAGTFFAGLVFYKKDTTATGLGATAAFAQTTGIPTAHYLALNEYGTTEGYADFTQDYVLRTTPFVKSDKKNVTWTCEVSENNTIILPYEPYLVNGSCEVTIYNLDNTTFTVAATGTTVSLNKEREDGTIEEKEWPSAIAVSYDRAISNFAETTATSITNADFDTVLVNEVLMYYDATNENIWVYNPFTGTYVKSANLYQETDYSTVDSVRVILGVRGASTSANFKGHVEISDVKVEYDSLSPIWTQHPGETYSKQYTMDEKGFSISSDTNMMFIDEDEIAAYTLDEKGNPETDNPVFQISGEKTILKKTIIKEDLSIENTTQSEDDAFIMKQYFVNNQWYFLFY